MSHDPYCPIHSGFKFRPRRCISALPVPARSLSPSSACPEGIPVLPKYSFDNHSELCLNTLSQRPVNRQIVANRIDKLSCDRSKRLITQNCNRTIIHFESIIKSKLLLTQIQFVPSTPCFAHLFCQFYQFLYDLGGLYTLILISLDRLFQHLRKRPALYQIRS